MKKLFICIPFVFITGCSTQGDFKKASSGSIGCSPDKIEISNLSTAWSFSGRTWEATCNGKRYFCNSIPGGQYGGGQIKCSPESN